MSHRVDLRYETGFTLIEMLVAAAIMMAVTGAVFALLNPAQGTFRAQPEVADMQQRLRAAVEVLRGDLMEAGGGVSMGASPGPLTDVLAPILPYRAGESADDPLRGVYFRNDVVSLLYVPFPAPQTHVVETLRNDGNELEIRAAFNCGSSTQDRLCGFDPGMRVLVMDPTTGTWDATTLTHIEGALISLRHSGRVNNSYGDGAIVAELRRATYYLQTDKATDTDQLRYYDGYETDLPVVDDVVALAFEYYGDPQPPRLLEPAESCLSDCGEPRTTYGPAPPALDTDLSEDDEYGAGENCLFRVENGHQVPRLEVLDAGSHEIRIAPAIFGDRSPLCPSTASAIAFDGDLLRIRHVRVTLRVQVGLASLRGPAGLLFTHGGTARGGERYVPDQAIRFDVTARNMNLGR